GGSSVVHLVAHAACHGFSFLSGMFRGRCSSGLEDDLAEAGSGLEVGVCGGGSVQGERPVDDGGRNVLAVEQGEQAREVTGTPHGGAEQVELAEVEAPYVEAGVLGAGGAQDHQPAARA